MSVLPVLGGGWAPPAFGSSALAWAPFGFFALAQPVVGVAAAIGGLAQSARGVATLVWPALNRLAQPPVDLAAVPAPTVVVFPACLVRYYEKVGRVPAVRADMSSCPLMQFDARSASWVLPEQLLHRINVVRAPDCDQPATPAAGAPPIVFVNVFLDRLMRDGAAIPAPDDAVDH